MKRCLFVFAVFSAAVAQSITPVVLFSNISTSPTSNVPGLPAQFALGTTTQFDRPFVSPNGLWWAFRAQTTLPSTENEIILTGQYMSRSGALVVAREGTATGFDGSVNFGLLRTTLGVDNLANVAFAADTTWPTGSDDVVVKWTGGQTLIAREGEPIPGMPGIGYGNLHNAVHVLESGQVRFRSAGLVGAVSQQVLLSNTSISSGSIVAQAGDVPGNQLVGPAQSMENFTSDRFRSDATGANVIYNGDLTGPTPTDLVMVFNGNVVAQEGVPLPNSPFAENVSSFSGDAGSQQVSNNGGHYVFRGSNGITNDDWVVLDGAVIARTDQPITPGNTELWDDTPFAANFFLNCVNSNGDYVVGGTTNSPNANANAVIVLNGTTVLVREGDPVDVDGNGLADDDAFVSVFNNDDAVLLDDGRFMFFADLRNSGGGSIGQAAMFVARPTIFGTVNLEDFHGDITAVPVTIEVRAVGSTAPLHTEVVYLDPDGRYQTATNLPPGNYDIAAKAPHWLRQRLSSVPLTASGIAGIDFSLPNGDLDGDNEIAIGDYALVSQFFGTSEPGGDVNGDGEVDIGDVAIISANFNRIGDD